MSDRGYQQGAGRGQATQSNRIAIAGAQPQQQHVIVLVPRDAGYNEPRNAVPDESTQWASSSFSDKRIRQAFIQKVYLIMTAMLLVTLFFVCIFVFVEPVKLWVHGHPYIMWISFGVYIIVYFVLICCDSVRRSFPANYICLILFNLAFTYVCATVSSYYTVYIVVIAIGITTLVCVAISIFAIQTKIDFTLCAGLIFVLSMVVMIFGLAVMFVFLFLGPNYILTCVYGALASLLLSLFLVYDTQIIVGGRKYQLSPEEYIYGALTLYMDVVMLYVIILSFFSNS